MEKQLITGLAQGDRRAFDAIYYMYVRRLSAFALTYVRNQEDAEELVEDVFISLWANRASIRNTSTVKPLLFTSLRNKIIDYYKKCVRSPLYEDYVNLNNDRGYSTVAEPMEYDEFENIVMGEISRLPATQEKVVRLSKIEGLSHTEIASRLGISMSTVRNVLSLGLRQLKERLAGHHGIKIISIVLIYLSR